MQTGVDQNVEEGGEVSMQSFDLLNRLGTNVSVMAGQPSTVEPFLQLSANEPAEAVHTVGSVHRNQSAAEFFALFAEPFEVEDAPVPPSPPLTGAPAAALPPVEDQPELNTPAQVETRSDLPGEIKGTSSGSKSIAENLRELRVEQETQVKERMELAKKREENESVLRCLREKVLKHEKEQLDLERKRKAMVAEEGATLRKMARLEALQRRVEEVM